jgi:hypothetical protein
MSLSDSPPSSAGARAADPLAQAAIFAGRAPSLHNSQPWRWDTDGHVLDLRLERSRVLTTSDPEGRFAILSCGAALHHARIHLAAHGWQAVVQRLPDDADTDLLARVRFASRTSLRPSERRSCTAICRLRRARAHISRSTGMPPLRRSKRLRSSFRCSGSARPERGAGAPADRRRPCCNCVRQPRWAQSPSDQSRTSGMSSRCSTT